MKSLREFLLPLRERQGSRCRKALQREVVRGIWCLWGALFLAFLACERNPVEVTPSRGSISGTVVDEATGQLLEGVSVWTLDPSIGKIRSTSTEGGVYILPNLPSGGLYEVIFEKAQYITMTGFASLSGSGTQLNMTLSKGDASITGTVYTPTLGPAAGASVVLDLRPMGYKLMKTVEADSNGRFAISDLPARLQGLNVSAVVLPYDINKDSIPDTETFLGSVVLYHGATSTVTWTLSYAGGGIRILQTNVEGTASLLPSDSVYFVFSTSAKPGSLSYLLQDVSIPGNPVVPAAVQWSNNNISLAIDPTTNLNDGHTYLISLAVAATNGSSGSWTYSFTVHTPLPLPGQATNLCVSAGTLAECYSQQLPADWTSSIYTLCWDNASGAVRYNIYAKDDWNNPNWTRIKDNIGTSPGGPCVNITLPSYFDYYTGDEFITPLAFKTKVSFAVTSVNADGAESPISGAPVSSVTDTVPPSVVSVSYEGDPNNSAGFAAITFTIAVTFSEYMNPSSSPSLGLPVTCAGCSAVWSLGRNIRSGFFEVSVPPGVDGSGLYTIYNALDSSDNIQVGPFTFKVCSPVNRINNPGFESGSFLSWTVAASAPSPLVSSENFHSGVYSAALGNIGYDPSISGNSAIYQALSLAGFSTATLSFWMWPISTQSAINYQRCYLTNGAGAFIATLFQTNSNAQAWSQKTLDLTPYIPYGTIRVYFDVYQCPTPACTTAPGRTGMYVDDVSVSGCP